MKKYLVAAGLLLAPVPAAANEGFYFGGHVGYLFGTGSATLGDPTGVAGGSTAIGQLSGGVQAGWQTVLPSRWMVGIELDLSFMDSRDGAQVLSYRTTPASYADEQLEYLGSLRGRLGYAIGQWTPFVTGGLAFASTRWGRTDLTTGNQDATPGQWRMGYTFGGGVDYAIDRRWTARAEYLYTRLPFTGFTFASAARYDSLYDLHQMRLGLSYHFGAQGQEKSGEDKRADDRGPFSWEIHGQTTFIFQGYPPINSPYEGANSLPGAGQSRETWTVSAFLGMRLWQGAELYYNPELFQGFGLANTVGAAGFPNGEAQKSNFPFPRYNSSRLFLRQEIGLGGPRETVESDYGQLAGEKDVSRLTVQVGKFAVHDVFDGNDYAEDPRADFLNWSIWAAGAFDYPADRVGLTYGITAELNQERWAGRVGYFLVGNQPNANVFDMNLFSRGGYVGELELRYEPFGKKGVAKLGSWLTSTFAGSYNDAVAISLATGLDATTAITQTRQTRTKYGFYLNLQQDITDDLGAFARFSWNDGRSEIGAFTDIDRSLSGGLQLRGTWWGRAGDRVGLAGAWNMISTDHSRYLAAGGLGVLVGDGRLSYAAENVVEAFYALQLIKGFTATADYQLLVNPAYNTDRGPVHVFSGRLSARF
jgi:high affinity Mn2+ porin